MSVNEVSGDAMIFFGIGLILLYLVSSAVRWSNLAICQRRTLTAPERVAYREAKWYPLDRNAMPNDESLVASALHGQCYEVCVVSRTGNQKKAETAARPPVLFPLNGAFRGRDSDDCPVVKQKSKDSSKTEHS